MKAITIWQPWASLIAVGAKPYEFRRWAAPKSIVGLRIAIHAGARAVRMSEVRALMIGLAGGKNMGALDTAKAIDLLGRVRYGAPLPLSHIICTAVLGEPQRADLIPSIVPLMNDSDRDSEFNFGWPLTEIEPLQPPIPARGAQGFWEWTA